MAYDQVDPARLEGDALTKWYQRSPTDIEQQRQAVAAQRYADFFGDPPGSLVRRDGTALDQSRSDPGDDQFGPDRSFTSHKRLHGDFLFSRRDDGASDGTNWTLNASDPTSPTLAAFETSQGSGSVQVAGPTKDQCIKQCTPLLERPQGPIEISGISTSV